MADDKTDPKPDLAKLSPTQEDKLAKSMPNKEAEKLQPPLSDAAAGKENSQAPEEGEPSTLRVRLQRAFNDGVSFWKRELPYNIFPTTLNGKKVVMAKDFDPENDEHQATLMPLPDDAIILKDGDDPDKVKPQPPKKPVTATLSEMGRAGAQGPLEVLKVNK